MSVTQSHDGNCTLVSTLDSTVRLFDKSNGELLSTYKGHANQKYKVDSALTNTDAYVISGSEDGSVCFWDLVEVRRHRHRHKHKHKHIPNTDIDTQTGRWVQVHD